MTVKGTRPQTVMTVRGMMNTTMKEMITKSSWHFLAFVATLRQAAVIRSGEILLGWQSGRLDGFRWGLRASVFGLRGSVSCYRLLRLGHAQQIPGVLTPQLSVLLFTHLVCYFVVILVGHDRLRGQTDDDWQRGGTIQGPPVAFSDVAFSFPTPQSRHLRPTGRLCLEEHVLPTGLRL